MGEEPARKRARIVHICEPATISLSPSPPLLAPELYSVFSESDSENDNVVNDSDSESEEKPSPPATCAVSEPSSLNVLRCGVGGTIFLWR